MQKKFTQAQVAEMITNDAIVTNDYGPSDLDDGSGYESAFSDDEEMFFNGMDPAQDDPRFM